METHLLKDVKNDASFKLDRFRAEGNTFVKKGEEILGKKLGEHDENFSWNTIHSCGLVFFKGKENPF